MIWAQYEQSLRGVAAMSVLASTKRHTRMPFTMQAVSGSVCEQGTCNGPVLTFEKGMKRPPISLSVHITSTLGPDLPIASATSWRITCAHWMVQCGGPADSSEQFRASQQLCNDERTRRHWYIVCQSDA